MKGLGLLLVVLGLLLGALWLRASTRADADVHPEARAVPASSPRATELEPAASLAPVEAEGAAPAPSRAAAPRSEPPRTAAPPRGSLSLLHGHVRAAGALPVFRAPAQLAFLGQGETLHAFVTEDGAYSLAGLRPGVWHVRVQKLGYRELLGEVELRAEDSIVERDFVLEPSWLVRVRIVTPAGEPYFEWLDGRDPERSGARPTVVATKAVPARVLPGASRATGVFGDGLFHVEDGPAELLGGPVLEVRATAPAYASLVVGDSVLVTRELVTGQQELEFVLDPEAAARRVGSVRLRLVSSVDRSPVTEAEIQYEPFAMDFLAGAEWSHVFEPGTHRLALGARGHAARTLEFELEPGAELDLGDVELEPELSIEGWLVDTEGRRVVGALELGESGADGRLRWRENFRYETDDEGRFRVGGLAQGSYVLRSAQAYEGADGAPAGFLPITAVSTLGGSVTGLELRLACAGVLVLKPGPMVATGLRFQVLDSQGELLAVAYVARGNAPRLVLPCGPVSLVLLDAQRQEVRREALAIPADTLELEVGP